MAIRLRVRLCVRLRGFSAVLALTASFAAANVGAADTDSTEALWSEAAVLEREAFGQEEADPAAAVANYRAAAGHFEQLAREGGGAMAHWRGARCHWLVGELQPQAEVDIRAASFRRAEALATSGIEVDPECAECMLWKFAGMGRLRTTLGIWKGIREVPKMAKLLDRAIALQPSYADDASNSTLGNLYYSSAIFYRVLPDWFWLGWFLGVRGDKDRALADIHSALAIHPDRLDYRVELGSQLLCQGATRSRRKKQMEQRKEILENALLVVPESRDDRREQAAARVMLQSPEKSCGYTGDTWIQFDESALPPLER
jgi:tetratricopeptide (TPR) repeat protein